MHLVDFVELLIKRFPNQSEFIRTKFAVSGFAKMVCYSYICASRFDAQNSSNFGENWIFEAIGLLNCENDLQRKVNYCVRFIVKKVFKNFGFSVGDEFDWNLDAKELFVCSNDMTKLREIVLQFGIVEYVC